MKQKDPKLISSIGLDSRSIKAFDLFFKSHCKSDFKMIDNHKIAAFTIIDLDAFKSSEKMALFIKDYENRQIISLSLIEQANCNQGNIHHIKKPVDHKELANLLKRLSAGKIKQRPHYIHKEAPSSAIKKEATTPPVKSKWVSSAKAAQLLCNESTIDFVGNQADIDITKPRDVLKISFDPAKKLLGSVMQACLLSEEKQALIELTHFGATILVDKQIDRIDCFLSDGLLRPRCLLESEETPVFKRLNPKYRDDKNAYKQAHKQTTLLTSDLDCFIWKVALWSSRGRIPQSVSLHTPVYLSEWPNLTRLAAIPHAMRIAALLSQQPQTLPDIALNLKIPQRYVFAFYSAANALGISNNCKRQVDNLFVQKSEKSSYSRSLLGKLLNRLSGFHTKDTQDKGDNKNYGKS